MKEKIIIIISLFLLLGTIVALSIYTIPFQTNRNRVYTDKKIEGYRIYETKYEQDEVCEPTSQMVVLFYDEDIYYTTSDLVTQGGCLKQYYIFYRQEFYSLQNALENDILTLETLQNYDFNMTIIQREKVHKDEDIVKVSYYENISTSELEKDVLINSVNLNNLAQAFDTLLFSNTVTDDSTLQYYLDFFTEEKVVTYAVFESYIQELETNKVAPLQIFTSFNPQYYQSFFIQTED